MRALHRIAAAALFAAAAVVPARAADGQERRETLLTLYKVMITNESCDLDMSEAEADAVSDAAEALVHDLRLTEEQANEVYVRARGEMEEQGGDKICDPQGDWLRAYRQAVQNALESPKG